MRSARDAGCTVPISNVSFVGSDAMLALLVKHGRAKGRDYTRALINSQVVPSYDDTALPGVAEYRALMDKHNPALPEALRDPALRAAEVQLHQPRGLRQRAGDRRGAAPGREPTRRGRPSARPSSRSAASTSASARRSPSPPERHQGLDSVYFTRVEGERWVPVADWAAAVKA